MPGRCLQNFLNVKISYQFRPNDLMGFLYVVLSRRGKIDKFPIFLVHTLKAINTENICLHLADDLEKLHGKISLGYISFSTKVRMFFNANGFPTNTLKHIKMLRINL